MKLLESCTQSTIFSIIIGNSIWLEIPVSQINWWLQLISNDFSAEICTGFQFNNEIAPQFFQPICIKPGRNNSSKATQLALALFWKDQKPAERVYKSEWARNAQKASEGTCPTSNYTQCKISFTPPPIYIARATNEHLWFSCPRSWNGTAKGLDCSFICIARQGQPQKIFFPFPSRLAVKGTERAICSAEGDGKECKAKKDD